MDEHKLFVTLIEYFQISELLLIKNHIILDINMKRAFSFSKKIVSFSGHPELYITLDNFNQDRRQES